MLLQYPIYKHYHTKMALIINYQLIQVMNIQDKTPTTINYEYNTIYKSQCSQC